MNQALLVDSVFAALELLVAKRVSGVPVAGPDCLLTVYRYTPPVWPDCLLIVYRYTPPVRPDCLLIVYRYTPLVRLDCLLTVYRYTPPGPRTYCEERVIQRVVNPRFVNYTASYDVASDICQALARGGR